AGAAAAVIVAYVKANGQYAVSDASRAIQSIVLTAWGDGVGSNWTSFIGLENVRREFGLPDEYDVIAVVPLGYPRRKVVGKKKRKTPAGWGWACAGRCASRPRSWSGCRPGSGSTARAASPSSSRPRS